MNSILTLTNKKRFIPFIWQHILLLVFLFILTLGVALCIRSDLGSSVISSTPLVFNIAGIGTLFAMVYVGFVMRTLDKHMGWFDRILLHNPGCRRYLYGLAQFLHSKIP